MTICSDNHEEIVYEGRICPLCEERETLEERVKELEEEIAELTDELKEK